MIIRGLLFCSLVCITTLAPVFILALYALAYTFFYTAYELIFLALAVDVFYGFGYPLHFPYYTIATLLWVFFVEWVKPYISVYNQ